MKKKILVAGGTGYIGSHTTVELQNAGYEVVIIDDLSNSNIEVLDGIEKITGIRPEFIQLDLKDKEGTRKALEAHPGIKGIILFAASKAVGESVQQPLKYYRNNIVTLVNLLEMMPEFNIEGIVFSSSCTVYGQPDPENLPVTENAPIKPAMSPYGNTKQINEEIIRDTISHRDFIPEVPVTEEKKETIPPVPKHTPEPFEIKRRNQDAFFEKMKQTSASPLTVQEENLFAKPLAAEAETNTSKEPIAEINSEQPTLENNFKEIVSEIHDIESTPQETAPIYEQQNLEQLDSHFLTKDARKKHKIIGQLFDTYWLIEYEDKLFIIDQHAAHEKVLYERTMKKISEKTFTSQTISPPVILTLNQDEVQALETYEAQLSMFGYQIEPFGGKEYAITAIPADFTDIDMKTMFIEMLDDFANISGKDAPNLIMEKVASMSCKAAVKGNNHLSRPEIEALIDELLELDNPYNCPHGRPTIISMTKYEIEKKFRRIV